MIIKSFRQRTRNGFRRLMDHLLFGDENDSVDFLQGSELDVEDMQKDAKAAGREYAIRHWIIAPGESISRDQFRRVVHLLGEEFGFAPNRAVIVEHEKPRITPETADQHWHVLVAEIDPVTNKVMSNSFDRIRHELVARRSEAEFGHPIILGAHTEAVIAGLRKRDLHNIANRLSSALASVPERPREAYSSKQYQEAKRQEIDLPALRMAIRDAWNKTQTGSAFRDELSNMSLRGRVREAIRNMDR